MRQFLTRAGRQRGRRQQGGAWLAALLLLSAGCGGSSSTAPAAPPDVPASLASAPSATPLANPSVAAALALQPPSALRARVRADRGASFCEASLQRDGAAYLDELPHGLVTRAANFATYSPAETPGGGLSGLAYALYAFDAGGFDRDPSLRLVWDTPPAATGQVYVGLADFDADVWDWYSLSGSQLALASLLPYIEQSGLLLAALVLQAAQPAVLTSLRLGSLPPQAAISATPASGPGPLTVDFDASASSDADGELQRYEWDFDADGIYEADTGSVPLAQNNYQDPSVYTAVVRVTDSDGVQDTAYVDVTVQAAPLADLNADVTEGMNPLTVNFDAALSGDADGSIVKYEWDFDGDGTFDLDSDTTPTAQHEYAFGSFTAVLRVTDNNGYQGTDTLVITVNESWMTPPVADLLFTQDSDRAPATITFDASGSTDDVAIVKYEWDWTTDGVYDLDSATTPTAQHLYNSIPRTATVRVTDGDGATDTASVDIDLDYNYSPAITALTATPQQGPAPLLVTLSATVQDNNGDPLVITWDLDGDGTYETNTGAETTTQTTYSTIGVYKPAVKAMDNYNATSQPRQVQVGATTPGWNVSVLASGYDVQVVRGLDMGLAKRTFFGPVFVPVTFPPKTGPRQEYENPVLWD